MLALLLSAMLPLTPAATASPIPEAGAAVSAPPASAPETAVIVRSASTNRAGATIVTPRNGAALVRSAAATRAVAVDSALTARLYADLERAGPLGDLPAGQCMKSASFGTTTVIAYGGQVSPDLQCPQNEIERALAADVLAISQLTGIDEPGLRRPLPVEPRVPEPHVRPYR